MNISGTKASNLDLGILTDLNAVAKRLANQDSTIWGPNTEAKTRLNWVTLPIKSRELLPILDAISAWSRSCGHEYFILCGMGGSSLAPEVIASTYGKSLVVLDSTDPAQILNSVPDDLSKTLVIISSKSGTTIETQSQFEFYKKKFVDNNLDPVDHIIMITDPDTLFDKSSRSDGYKVINADPNVGGRFSALSAFGLVPAALLGVDVSILLDDAERVSKSFVDLNSPAAVISAALYSLTDQFIEFSDSNSQTAGLSDWIEQLIAESTGKDKTGRLPVIVDDVSSSASTIKIGFAEGPYDLIIEATLGEQFILWEWVTVLLCYLLKVDPFNQPNVTEAKDRTSNILANGGDVLTIPPLAFENTDFAIFSYIDLSSISEFIKLQTGYFAVMAYLTRGKDDEITKIRSLISTKSNTPTTFGWGPRFLHSTGQFHKGGQTNGAFIQITGEVDVDVLIPNKPFTFKQLQMAQALGDAQALSERGLPIIRIHLKNRKRGIARIIAELEKN